MTAKPPILVNDRGQENLEKPAINQLATPYYATDENSKETSVSYICVQPHQFLSRNLFAGILEKRK